MKKHLFLLLAASVALAAQALDYKTVAGDPTGTRIYTLSNGLTVYLSYNPIKPEIQTYIAVKAGSQNDPLESTGLAHYQEHIMFKGTKQYGTTDYEKEKAYLDRIDDLYEKYGKTSDPEERKAIYHLIDSISYLSSQISIANEFDKLMQLIGATGVNAYTSTDRTCYHEVIPAGELERWAMIESDRFQNLVVRGFHTELETVYEEFNLYSTQDNDKVDLAIDQLLCPEIPYRQHTVLGTQEHLKSPSLKNIKWFYNQYYRPNNVAIILSGDFDYEHAMDIIERYFGDWKPNEKLEPFKVYDQKPLAAHKDSIVYGVEAPEVWLAWLLPDVTNEDIPAFTMLGEVLYNGKCGLIDSDVMQQQRLLSAWAYLNRGNDYSMFYAYGQPKSKQKKEEVKLILLEEVEKIRRGEFDEHILKAIINNFRRYEMTSRDNNGYRARVCLNSFIYGIPYEELLFETDRLEKVTKEDIVRVANKYLGDSYACVYKEQGEGALPPEMVKPTITPIEMNRDKQSDFVEKISRMKAEELKPQFLDFHKDVQVSELQKGQEFVYKTNTTNALFNLTFTFDRGDWQHPELSLLGTYMGYLGTGRLSTQQFQRELYNLACEMWVSVHSYETTIGIYGLQENMDEALRLLEDWILTATPDEAKYKELTSDVEKAHNDSKSDQRSCFGQLAGCGLYGLEAIRNNTLTPKQMKQLSGGKLLTEFRSFLPGIAHVVYYGPMRQDEIMKKLITDSRLLAMSDPAAMNQPKHVLPVEVRKSEVWVAPYKANNLYFYGYANWGEVYTPKDEAVIRLFNEYFDGSMGGIVFQEMRESRALCYASGATFVTPDYEGEHNYFTNFIISQNDKIKECMETFATICNDLPKSEAAFQQAKTSLLKSMEKRRYVGYGAISSFLYFRDLGWDHDWNEDIYQAVQNMTLDDVINFQREHIANLKYRYMILGDPKRIDLNFLKTQGELRQLKIKDIFVY